MTEIEKIEMKLDFLIEVLPLLFVVSMNPKPSKVNEMRKKYINIANKYTEISKRSENPNNPTRESDSVS